MLREEESKQQVAGLNVGCSFPGPSRGEGFNNTSIHKAVGNKAVSCADLNRRTTNAFQVIWQA